MTHPLTLIGVVFGTTSTTDVIAFFALLCSVGGLFWQVCTWLIRRQEQKQEIVRREKELEGNRLQRQKEREEDLAQRQKERKEDRDETQQALMTMRKEQMEMSAYGDPNRGTLTLEVINIGQVPVYLDDDCASLTWSPYGHKYFSRCFASADEKREANSAALQPGERRRFEIAFDQDELDKLSEVREDTFSISIHSHKGESPTITYFEKPCFSAWANFRRGRSS